MDPTANIAEQLKLATRSIEAYDKEGYLALEPEDHIRLAELVQALDEWIRRGGSMPSSWERK